MKGEFDGEFETALKFVHPDDLEYVVQQSHAMLAEKTPRLFEYRIITSEGRTKDILGHNRLIMENGHIIVAPEHNVGTTFEFSVDIQELAETVKRVVANGK